MDRREEDNHRGRDPELALIAGALAVIARSVIKLAGAIQHLHHQGETIMANIESLRALQGAQSDAITALGETIVTEAAQVTQILADLVAAQSNGVTADDVAAAQASLDRLSTLGTQVAGIAPDA